MLNREECKNIISKLVTYTANYATVSIRNNDEHLTRYANSEIHQNVEIEDTIINLTVYKGKKEATCSVNILSDDGLKQLAADADAILELAPDGEFEIIPLKTGENRETLNDDRLAESFGITQRAQIVKKCVDSLHKDYTASGVISLNRDMVAFGDSNGVFRYSHIDSVNFNAVVTHKDGATGFGTVTTASYDDSDVEKAFNTAYEKAKESINPVLADIGSYTVILEPEAVADLVWYLMMGFNAASVQRGSSYAAGKLNRKIFGENITIRDDVNNPATFRRYFDAEGYDKKPLTLIKKGIVINYLYDSKTALKDGVETTGHAFSNKGGGGMPCNVIMEGGESSLEEMIAGTKKGILVTHFHYTNSVNPKTAQVTGLTRDGTFMIEDGKIAYPILNMRFTQNIVEAFNNVKALSKDLTKVDFIGGTALFPAVMIECFHFTGKQK